MLSKLWSQEPALLTMAASGAFWVAIFEVLSAFGHPLTPDQRNALLALIAIIGTIVTRSQVYAPATVDQIKLDAKR